ncbi:DNA-binding response regulator [Pontibacter diazotrophicus]|uniref:DNA-binding response regulator n=1 Tax=Pontibacter diazotrophicus TaxID=1400979 RepID=A0A3D8L3F6_9BACT|nr:LytTR family DNA-binding domain-containing protein [Pontibacter diazotrophicus]RDV11512.1 DNA-binding response regulator [Pontibacter diazotrophicus]
MSKPLSCLIVDDEPIAQDIIEKYIAKVPFLNLLDKCDNAIDALELIRELQPDLIFLDIKMPEMTGLELVRVISNYQLHVILTTAYPDYALEGFELEVAGYLLKPISFDRFLKAVNKVYEIASLQWKVNAAQVQETQERSNQPQFLWVKQDKKLIQINTEEIILVKGMKDYVQFFLPGEKVITHMTMAKIEDRLPSSQFLRVSRSYIVRKSAIKAIHGNTVETELKEEIIIGSTYREMIKKEILEWLK